MGKFFPDSPTTYGEEQLVGKLFLRTLPAPSLCRAALPRCRGGRLSRRTVRAPSGAPMPTVAAARPPARA